jgi:hypothetical protein
MKPMRMIRFDRSSLITLLAFSKKRRKPGASISIITAAPS